MVFRRLLWFSTVTIQLIVTVWLDHNLRESSWQPKKEKGLKELAQSCETQVLDLSTIAPPVKQQPSIEYPLFGALGEALSVRYPVLVTQ